MASLIDQIRQALAELELVSHAPAGAYGRQAHDTSESKGGRRPPGADYEFRPRKPSSPLREGDAMSEKEWAEFDDELAAWDVCYQRRTVAYFRKRLASRGPTDGLLSEVRETARAWRVLQIPAGQPPALGDPQWKRYIAESERDGGDLAREFGVSRQYIHQVRRDYRL